MQLFVQHMRTARMSESTIQKRVEIVERLRDYLTNVHNVALLEATADLLVLWQQGHGHLAPASLHIYTRHVTAFFRWAAQNGHIPADPSARLGLPILHKAVPHPMTFEDMRTVFACATGRLYTSYILAAFAGLRCGEIVRLHSSDINYNGRPVALIHGKGGKERRVPLLEPVVREIQYKRGWIVTKNDGTQCQPHNISGDSTKFLAELGIPSTLHSLRAAFATHAAELTHDVLLVRDLLGHQSVKTTEIYMATNNTASHDRLVGMTSLADNLLTRRPA